MSALSRLSGGVAVVSAAVLAVMPVVPVPDHLAVSPERVVDNLDVNLLASSIDPITPWVTTFQTSLANIRALTDFYLEQPVPLLTTIGKNQLTYLKELPDIGLIANQISGNLQTFFQAPWWNQDDDPIPNGTFASQYISSTQTVSGLSVLFDSQKSVYNLTAPLLAAQGPAWLGPLLEFTATPYSGQLIGLLSPVLSSVVQLTRSFTAIGEYFQKGDALAAINELINIPANTTNASLNGAGLLDLTAVIKNILPPSLAPLVKEFGLNLGGLISPPVPFNGSLTNANKPPTAYTGGTLFDGVQTKTTVGAETTGLPVGAVSSVIGLGQFLGDKIMVPPPATAAALVPAAGAAVSAPVKVESPAAGPELDDVNPVEKSAAQDVSVVPGTVVVTPARTPQRFSSTRGDSAGSSSPNAGPRGHRGAS